MRERKREGGKEGGRRGKKGRRDHNWRQERKREV